MAKWNAILGDGRELFVYAPDEAGARHQVEHAETTRIVIATKREQPIGPQYGRPYPSGCFSVTRIKD